MATLTIRNVTKDVLIRLRAQAKRNRRSMQGELLHVLERAVAPSPAEPMALPSAPHTTALVRKRS